MREITSELQQLFGLTVCQRTVIRDVNALYDIGFVTKLKRDGVVKIAFAGKAWPLRFTERFDFDIQLLEDDRIELTREGWGMVDPTPQEMDQIEERKAAMRRRKEIEVAPCDA